MLKTKIHLVSLTVCALTFVISSCTKEDDSLESLEVSTVTSARTGSTNNSNSPWDTDSSYSSSDDFQVDNDGRGAHNWNESEWDSRPSNNGFNIRTYIYGDGSRAILSCPNGNGSRRAEYRDQTNIDLDRRNKQDLTFDIRNYNNNDELIMAQLHNDDSRVRRPYITVVAEDGEIELKRTNNYSGSGTTTSSSKIRFRTNDRYRIRMESNNNTRSVNVRIDNLDTGERAETNFSFDSSWNNVDGSFYWKHGAYMPDGGSNNTCMRVESVSFTTNRT